MTYYLFLAQFILGLTAIFLTWQAVGYFRRMWLWKKVRAMPMPERYRTVLEKIPHYRALPSELKERLRPKMLFFIETKEFVGVKTEVTDEMRALIAFYACMMVVNIPQECYDQLVTILIYPSEVVLEEVDDDGGIYAQRRLILEGESVADTVVIAWHDAKREAYHPSSHNVIVHEMAHLLDFEDGFSDGVPPLEPPKYRRWVQVLSRRFSALRERASKNRNWGDYRLFGAYAATNEAEFFAVATERFFQKPKSLKTHFPDIYGTLQSFYRLDPAEIFKNIND
ncbi:M90 family metallopeptidase [Hydrogenimonas cancrithermarum]|uniref:Zinc-dependent peptidase n=1 Tax=Hydrogenimonas cancrithermarum TaxID=2993563 RepID=A0ABN6WUB4_9BACT|nr:M90 family metallopeptidase [Hydrogenimonas cancrithermarum]BDY11722.1 hypothetical protein HCR_00340 [Hydrogenimonas cancrithermarum]